jgi:hypothetical protein
MATVRHLGLFPFCVSKFPPTTNVNGNILVRDVGRLTEYPFQLPINICTRMWWVVKHWKVSFNYYQYRDLGDGDYTLIDQSFSLSTKDLLDNQNNPDYVRGILGFNGNEKNLVCVTSGTEYETATRSNIWEVVLEREFKVGNATGTNQFETIVEFYTNWDTQQNGFPPPFVKSRNEDEPMFWVAFSFGFRGWTSWVETSGGQAGSGVVSLFGIEKTLELSGPELVNPVTSESINNLRIEAEEYWPYDPDDGLGPIYDKDTGAQLRAFPA